MPMFVLFLSTYSHTRALEFMSKLSNFGLKKINMANNVIKAISDKLPFKVTDAQYVGIDVGLEWFSKTKGTWARTGEGGARISAPGGAIVNTIKMGLVCV